MVNLLAINIRRFFERKMANYLKEFLAFHIAQAERDQAALSSSELSQREYHKLYARNDAVINAYSNVLHEVKLEYWHTQESWNDYVETYERVKDELRHK